MTPMADKSNTTTTTTNTTTATTSTTMPTNDASRTAAAAVGTIKNHNNATVAAAAVAATTLADLQTCTPKALAEWLLQHRFYHNEMNVTDFLLQAVSSLPNAQAISDQMMMGNDNDDNNVGAEAEAVASAEKEEEAAEPVDLGNELLMQPIEVSLTVPRTKAVVTWYKAGIRFVDKKQRSFTLHPNTVERMILFPKPEDCQPKKKVPSDLVLLVLKSDTSSVVLFKSKAVKQVCLQLPADLPVWKTKQQGSDDDDDDLSNNLDHTDQWKQVFCQSLGLDTRTQTARVWNPSSSSSSSTTPWTGHYYQFVSHQEENTSTTTGGMPFVQCYYGVNDGVLYPMAEGLLFFKPPLFLPRSTLHSIACGRGGGSGGGDSSSRYVDLTVEMEHSDPDEGATAAKTLEFTNIHRSELTVMREYIHKTLIPAMQKDAAGEDASSNEEGQEQNNSDDVDAEAVEEEEESSSSNRRGGKRKASVEARAVTKRMQIGSDEDEDDDDDDDYGGEEHDDEGMSEADDEEESDEDEDKEDGPEDEEGADTESEGEE